MDKKKWYGIGTLTVAAAALAIYLAPYVEARQQLAPMSVNAILSQVRSSLRRDSFGETLTYQNSMLPPGVNLASFFALPVPSANVRYINLYQNSPEAWRFEEMTSSDNIVGVVARAKNHLVTYQGATNQRTLSPLPTAGESTWNLWQIPKPSSWESHWTAQVARTTLGMMPAYKVTLTPKFGGTLWGHITYWVQGRYFIPLGVQVTDVQGDTVFLAKADTFTQGSPGASATPPSAGTLVAWKAPKPLAAVTRQLMGGTQAQWIFPTALGPLERTSERQLGSNALAVYGTGPGRVIVLDSATKVWSGRHISSFLRPIRGSSRYEGVTDGVFSVVIFQYQGREITLMGSRAQGQLARWATVAWR